MRYNKYILTLLICIFCLNACTQKSVDHINIDDHQMYHHQKIHESLNNND